MTRPKISYFCLLVFFSIGIVSLNAQKTIKKADDAYDNAEYFKAIELYKDAYKSAKTKDEKGHAVRFGSIGGGGRYDGLVGRFRSETIPATGFSIGVSRLFAALKLVGSPIVSAQSATGPVVVLVLDRERLADYQQMVAQLREAGVASELYLGGAGMKAQMKYADRRNSPLAIIQGSDEKARGEVQIKDLIAGAKAAAAISTNEEWKAQRPAQFSVPETELVARVQALLKPQSA